MADEQEVHAPEVEEPKNDVPAEVKVAEPTPTEDYAKENEQVKDKLAEFGQTDIERFIAKVTSDSIFARQVIRKLLGLDEELPMVFNKTAGSPQENNITGDLVHTTFPPLVKNVNTDIKPVEKEAQEVGTVEKVG